MKKLLMSLLCFAMAFSAVGCMGSDANKDSGNATDSSVNETADSGSADSSTNTDSNGDSSNDEQKIDPTAISNAMPFSEGYAFVHLNKDLSKEYCIDKQGNIIFTLDVGVAYETTGFYNGICAYGSAWDEMSICDKTGKITTAEDLGGTRIPMLTRNQGMTDAFRGGYFFVEKTETTFADSVTKMAIFNSKLEKIVDFSEELAEIYGNCYRSEYYYGYLVSSTYEVLDLSTGKLVEDVEGLIDKVEIEHASDLWYYKDGGYYNKFFDTETPKIDLSEYSETLGTASDFKDGEAYLVFNSNNINFFTILLDNGDFAFEPVQLEGTSVSVAREAGKYVVATSGAGEIKLQIFDKNGVQSEAVLDSNLRTTIEIQDGVILVRVNDNLKASYEYYNLDLTKLFG